jgi:plastocyanin
VPRLARSAPLVLLLLLGLILGGHARGARTDGTLTAVAGPGFSISLKDAAGANVAHLDPGTYTINVDDLSMLHNFHLFGPGVEQSTSVEGKGSTTWTVTFRDGTYKFQCDMHVEAMHGGFTVGAGDPAPPPTPPAPPAPLPRLVATVGPEATISVRRPSGAAVKRLARGRYRITVRDRAAFHNFHLTGPGLNRRTSLTFAGTATWTVTLKPGIYRFVCDPHKTVMRGSFRVT